MWKSESKARDEKGCTTSQLLKTSVVPDLVNILMIDNEVSSSISYRMWQSETCTASQLRTLNLKPVANSK